MEWVGRVTFFSLFLFCFLSFVYFFSFSFLSFVCFVVFVFCFSYPLFFCFPQFFILCNLYLKSQSCVPFCVYIILLQFEFIMMKNCMLIVSLKKSNEKKRMETSGRLLISSTNCRISTKIYNNKLFHRCCSSILHKNEKYRFEDVHVIKILVNYLEQINS